MKLRRKLLQRRFGGQIRLLFTENFEIDQLNYEAMENYCQAGYFSMQLFASIVTFSLTFLLLF